MSCSSDDQSDKECPLCMETLEIDDINFYPCKCEYQICRFCWHRLRTDENGLCPACRQPYPEDPVNFKPLSTADLQKIKSEKKMKAQAEKQRISESRQHLAAYRVLQKNLVYVIGLSSRVAEPETLKKAEYFGRYGKICKVAVGTTTSGLNGAPSHTAYVTYSRVEEALRAIQGVQNAMLDGRLVKASLGTTKYCSSFLRTQPCYKQECMYLHDMADDDISFTKDDMHMGRHTEYERRLMDTLLKTPPSFSLPAPPPLNSTTPTPPPTAPSIPATTNASAAPTPPPNASKKIVNGVKEEDEGKKDEPANNKAAAPPAKKSEEKKGTNGTTPKRNATEKKRIVSNGVNVVSAPARAPPPHLSASPPDDWASRDDEPSSSPPALPTTPPLSAPNSLPSTLTPHSNTDTVESVSGGGEEEFVGVSMVEEMLMSEDAPKWQAMLGLTPRAPSPPFPPSTIPAFYSDDDLGFDPYAESTKELAALVEEEKRLYERRPNASMYSGEGENGGRVDGVDEYAVTMMHDHGHAHNNHHHLPHHPHLPSQHSLPPRELHSNHSHHQLQQPFYFRPHEGVSTSSSGVSDVLGGGGTGMDDLVPHSLHQQPPHLHPSEYHRMAPPPHLESSPLDAFSFHSLSSSSHFPSLDFFPRESPFSTSLFTSSPPPGLLPLPSLHHSLHPHPNAPPGLGPPRNPPLGVSAAMSAHNLPLLPSHHAPPPQATVTSSSAAVRPTSMAEWQEGLKALLPNVNVRFAADLEREQSFPMG